MRFNQGGRLCFDTGLDWLCFRRRLFMPRVRRPDQVSRHAPRGSHRRVPRHQGRRPVPLARRRRPQVEGGRGWVEAQNKVTYAYPRRRSRSARRSRSGSPSCGTTRSTPPRPRSAAATSSARTTACRTSPCSTCRTRSTASRACCSTRTPGRRTAPSPSAGTVGQRRRQVPRLRRRRGRLRLADVEGARRRHRQAARRRAEVGQVQRRVLDARTARASSTAAIDEPKKGDDVPGRSTSTRRSTTTARHAAERRRARLQAARPARLGLRRPASPRTAATSSSPSGKGTDDQATASPTSDLAEPYGDAGRPDRQLRQRVHVHRQRRPGLLLQDRPRTRRSGRVIAIDIRKPDQENWKEIIPQAKENARQASAWSATCSSRAT